MPEPAFTLPGIRVHLPRNRCSRSPESVFTMLWNGCSPSAGICVHDAPEYANRKDSLRIHVGNARKPPKQRAWRKLHIAVDRETGNIVASELTASRARDATRVPALLTQIQAPLVSVAADSAYDKEAVYEAIEAHSPGRRTRVVIPPQRNATLSQNSNTAMQERDRHIRAIERHGRREWYKLSGYTKRSMVENAIYRYKAIIGPEMRARTLARQRVEHRIGCEILNKMAALGMPDTYCAG